MTVGIVTKDNYRHFITDTYMVPSWEHCRKAIRILTNGSKESEIPFQNEVSLGDGRSFDWRVFVANHRWVDELLSFKGVVQAVATRHEVNQHYHLFLHCGDGQRLLMTNNTLRRFDNNGEKHWMKQSERAVLKGFDEALCALRESGWELKEEGGWQNGNFNASIRDMVGEFFSEAIFGVALGDPTTSHWTKILENPELIKVREDPRMMTVLDDYDLRARWVEYVQEHFVILKLTDYGTKNLCRLKAMSMGSSISNPSHSHSAIPLKTRRLALLYPAPALQYTREAVQLPPDTTLSLSLANPVGMLVCDSGAFFLRVSTASQQGYLRISDAPYSSEPLLAPADDFHRGFKARRYTVQEAETRYDAKPSAWSPIEPQVASPRPVDVNEIDSVTSDELTVYRTEAAVEVLQHDRLWRISSNPFYYRGEIPPWRGIELVLSGDKKDFKTRKLTLRIIELERILSFGLTECNSEDCLCRVKYPGVQQEVTRRKCVDSVGFSTTGKKWDRGRLSQDGICDMNVSDVITLVLGVDDSGSMFKTVEFVLNGKPCPVTLEAKRSGRLIFKGSGKWSVALLVGGSHVSESEALGENTDVVTPTKPLWQPRPLPSDNGWQDVTC